MKKIIYSFVFMLLIFSCAPKYSRIDNDYVRKLANIEVQIRIHLENLYEKKLQGAQLLETKRNLLKPSDISEIKNQIKILNALIKEHEYTLSLLNALKSQGALSNEEYRKLLQFHFDLLTSNKFALLFNFNSYIQKNTIPTPLLVPKKEEEQKKPSAESEKISTLRALIANKLLIQARVMHNQLSNQVTSVEEAQTLRELSLEINSGMTEEIEAKIQQAENLITEHKIQEAYNMLLEVRNTYKDVWPQEETRLKVENYVSTLAENLKDISMEQRIGIYDDQKVVFNEAVAIYENAQNSRNLLDALQKFESLQGTTFEDEAHEYIKKTKDKLAQEERTEAANILLQARKMKDADKKKETLMKALKMLRKINKDYPENSLRQKIEQNIAAVIEEIREIDPSFDAGSTE